MKTLRFKNEKETADMVIRLEMACSRFTVTGRTEIMVEDDEPALVLPPSFVGILRDRLTSIGVALLGATKRGTVNSVHRLYTSEGVLVMKGTFSVNDVMEKLI